jgi:non-specific serine/threonine protein kinase
MHVLTITPQGHLLVRESDTEVRPVPRALLEAYEVSAARGMLHSATEALDSALPMSFEFARSIARLYLTNLCKTATGEPGEPIPPIPPPEGELEHSILQAPPMLGLEYLDLEAVSNWWRELDALTRKEVSKHPGGARAYLHERNPQWRFVGRVTFHLAENKRDTDYPFAFLATFANGLTAQGKVRHEPLGQALRQYANEGDREGMLSLLLPVFKASESSPLIRKLVDSGQIDQPLAWSPREAYAFLETIPILEASGVIVRVPDWWNDKKPSRPRVNVKIDTENSAGLGADAMLRFSVELSLDGEKLTQTEIDELLQSSGGLVPLKGKWVEVDREKLKHALEHWKQVEKSVRREGISFFEGMRLLSGANFDQKADDEDQSTIREWSGLAPGPRLEAILQRLRAPETREQAPPGLRAELRPYQQTGYAWLRFVGRLGLGGCLADDMGLGKTIQVLSLLLDLQHDGIEKASLLVVPASLIANWKTELARFAPGLSYAVVHPSEEREVRKNALDRHDLIITTYGMLVRTAWLRKHRWRLAILDEAQAIKNSGTKQTMAVKELVADSRIAMTGTPVENRLSDLWSLFDFLNPGLLGSAKEFATFIKHLERSPAASFEPLRNLVRPYILRRLKTDKRVISDLPDKTEVKAYCALTKHQAALYQKVVEELAQQLRAADGMQRRGIVLAQLMRLKQICNHPAQATGTNDYQAERSGKFRRLAEIVEEIAARQEKLLVFTQFREITEPLSAFLAQLFGRAGLVLHGGTNVKKRKEFVEQFQREDGPPYFILSLKAGGTGLNLTAASHVIHFDRWWNPAIENQATDRAFRIGQKKNVLVHKFICRGTVEERIDEMIDRKSSLADEAIGGQDSGEALLTEMDNDTLMKFVELDLHHAIEG